MTGFRQQSLNEGILNGSGVSSRLVAIHLDIGEFTSSAYNFARQVLSLNGMANGSEQDLHHLATEWVAWVNSIWISKLLDIEPRHSILGMVMDEPAWQGSHNNTVTRSIEGLVKFVASKFAVRHRLTTARSVSNRCMLINEMSTHFFFLASGESYRRSLQSNSLGVFAGHTFDQRPEADRPSVDR
jgi:hypothetical protein